MREHEFKQMLEAVDLFEVANRFGPFKLIEGERIYSDGIVAEGIRFSTGAVAVHWLWPHRHTAVYPSIGMLRSEQRPKGREIVFDE